MPVILAEIFGMFIAHTHENRPLINGFQHDAFKHAASLFALASCRFFKILRKLQAPEVPAVSAFFYFENSAFKLSDKSQLEVAAC